MSVRPQGYTSSIWQRRKVRILFDWEMRCKEVNENNFKAIKWHVGCHFGCSAGFPTATWWEFTVGPFCYHPADESIWQLPESKHFQMFVPCSFSDFPMGKSNSARG